MNNLTPRQVELRAIQILERLEKGGLREDSLVELKREISEPYKIARRIAGHCNAAKGDTVIWIIGADENDGVVGWSPPDLAEFLPKVWRFFEGHYPSFVDVHFEYNGKQCTVLAFDASRPPYLVKNENFGGSGVVIEREIPWRDGTRLRTANRADVLRLILDQTRLPDVEILKTGVSRYSTKQAGELQDVLIPIDLWVEFYLVPLDEKPVIIPIHRIACRLSDEAKRFIAVDFGNFYFQSEEGRRRAAHRALEYARNGGPAFPMLPDADSLKFTSSEAIIYSPTKVCLRMSTAFDRHVWDKSEKFEINLVFQIGSDRTPLILVDQSVPKVVGEK